MNTPKKTSDFEEYNGTDDLHLVGYAIPINGVKKPVKTTQLPKNIIPKDDTKVDKVDGKVLSTNDYDTVAVQEVAKIKDKVDKVSGKGLSETDFTQAEKNKLASLTNGGGIPVEIISEIPIGLVNGSNKTYTLSKVPLSKAAMFITVNGIIRKNFTLIENTFILSFSPSINSKIEITYFTNSLSLIGETKDVSDLKIFMNAYINENNIVTDDNGEVIIDEGEFVTSAPTLRDMFLMDNNEFVLDDNGELIYV